MRKGLATLAVAAVGALGIIGCASGEETSSNGHSGLHEYETKFLEKHEGVSHKEAEREAGEAEELAERIQRSGIKTEAAGHYESPACKSDHEMLKAEKAPGGTPAYAVEAEEMVQEDCDGGA